MSLLPAHAQEGLRIPAPKQDIAASGRVQTAVFAGGCFWGVQGVFQHVSGVKNAVSGYAGGAAATAHYRMIGSGRTGHAEAVRITYDPAKISYGRLLQIFFSAAHDPTQLNRQGPDIGSQYRSAIFPQSKEQAAVARAYIDQLNATRLYAAPIVTTIEQSKPFYPAEAYHQDYLVNNPMQPYIRYNDLPKIEHLKTLFPDLWRKDPILVVEAGMEG
ncbi:peptide-methionine (S)-S-oxide reductase MsrA [Paracoccus aestuariivivens]|nr:peptide-methionine (S)-S-oxide reductase MsrA [Paracoccus aestuariivivens]